MTFVASLGAYLRSYAPLTDLVGQRIYPVRAPDSTTSPYVVYKVRIKADNTLTEASPLDVATVTVSAYATGDATHSGYEQAHDVAAAVRSALNFFRGTMGGGVSVEGSETPDSEDSEAAEFGTFCVDTTAEIFYRPQ